MKQSLFGLFLLVHALPGRAGDGVIEINQVCAISTGCVPGDAPGFPVEIQRPGSYRLTSNLDIRLQPSPGSVNVIQLRASDVTLDLNGFALIGPVVCSGTPTVCVGAGTGAGVLADPSDDVSNITVQNGTIRGLGGNGVHLENVSSSEGFEVVRIRAVSNGLRGIRLVSNALSSIRDCRLERNGSFGISIAGIDGGGLIEGNLVARNGSSGINSAAAYLIIGNTSVGNAFYGIIGSSDVAVQSNVVADNPSGGISVGPNQLGPNLCGTAPCP